MSRRRGMSLIEVMLAGSMGLAVMVLLYHIVALGMKRLSYLDQQCDAAMMANNALNILRRDLRASGPGGVLKLSDSPVTLYSMGAQAESSDTGERQWLGYTVYYRLEKNQLLRLWKAPSLSRFSEPQLGSAASGEAAMGDSSWSVQKFNGVEKLTLAELGSGVNLGLSYSSRALSGEFSSVTLKDRVSY
jgi:Tfp pilus assembly protein PilW